MNIKDLKVGGELECIDRDSFTRERISTKDAIDFVLTIDSIDHSSVYVRSQLNANHVARFHIYLDELRFFKKKEQYTFDDLIDVAVQAVKDKVINGANIRLQEIDFMHNNTHYKLMPAFDCKEQINLIKSLYNETFVIECEEDCKKIKQNAKITFLNGNSVVMDQPPTGDGIVRIWNDGRYDFIVLKGATVEQSK